MTLDDLKAELTSSLYLRGEPHGPVEFAEREMVISDALATVYKLGQQDALGKLRERFEAWEVWETPETVSLKYRESLKNDPGLNAGKAMNWLTRKALQAIDDLLASLSDK